MRLWPRYFRILFTQSLSNNDDESFSVLPSLGTPPPRPMPPPSLLLPLSKSHSDFYNDAHSSEKIRLASIEQLDAFKVVIGTPEQSPLPESLFSDQPTCNHQRIPSKDKKKRSEPGYLGGNEAQILALHHGAH